MKATTYWEHALKGSAWLVQNQNADGSWIGLEDQKVDAFYKGSWALMATGQPAAAHRSLNYVQRHFLQADGDVLPREHPWHYDVHYLYANAYVIIGSMVTGRYEIAMPAVQFMLTQQDPDHGGFYTRRTPAGEREMCDTMSVGAAGVACLAAGQLAAARRAADYFARIVELQPAPAERFFTTIESDGRIGTTMQTDDEPWWRIVDAQTENQCWYAVGLPFAFLVRLAEATGEDRYRELAQWYFDFQLSCVNPWDGGSSGKAGWACAMLYRITGEDRYRDIAFHVADLILGKQGDDGSWVSLGQGYTQGQQAKLTNSDFDANAEFTLWLALISSNILARDAD